MKTTTIIHKTKTINPRDTINHNVLHAAATKKSVTARSASTRRESAYKCQSKANIYLILISHQSTAKIVQNSKQSRLIAQPRAAPYVMRKKLGLIVICVSSAKIGERRYRIVNLAIIV